MERLANFGSFVITSISLRLALEKLTLLLSRDIFSLFLDKATVITVTIKRQLNFIVSTADTHRAGLELFFNPHNFENGLTG